MVQKDLNGHLDRVNLLIQLTHGQGHLNEWTLSELFLRIRGSPTLDNLRNFLLTPATGMLSFLNNCEKRLN